MVMKGEVAWATDRYLPSGEKAVSPPLPVGRLAGSASLVKVLVVLSIS
jgi:hypothetical protein